MNCTIFICLFLHTSPTYVVSHYCVVRFYQGAMCVAACTEPEGGGNAVFPFNLRLLPNHRTKRSNIAFFLDRPMLVKLYYEHHPQFWGPNGPNQMKVMLHQCHLYFPFSFSYKNKMHRVPNHPRTKATDR